jgi:hypothetical protein
LSSRCRLDRFSLLRSAGSSVECVPDLPCYGRGNDQGNDQADLREAHGSWRPSNSNRKALLDWDAQRPPPSPDRGSGTLRQEIGWHLEMTKAGKGRSGPWVVLVDPGRSATIRLATFRPVTFGPVTFGPVRFSRVTFSPVTFSRVTVVRFTGRGSGTTVVGGRLIAVWAVLGAGRPAGQLGVPSLTEHPAKQGANQHCGKRADSGQGADVAPLGPGGGNSQAAQVAADGAGVGLGRGDGRDEGHDDQGEDNTARPWISPARRAIRPAT